MHFWKLLNFFHVRQGLFCVVEYRYSEFLVSTFFYADASHQFKLKVLVGKFCKILVALVVKLRPEYNPLPNLLFFKTLKYFVLVIRFQVPDPRFQGITIIYHIQHTRF